MSALSTPLPPLREEDALYPETDGQPIADSTLQFDWIVRIKGGIDAVFSRDPDVFVAGDLFWYPVEGRPDVRTAPDVMVAFGRPKGHRRSYLQWREADIPPQVVFEILSPGNRIPELVEKHRFYERHGVEEYYLYDPDSNDLSGWLRDGQELRQIPEMRGWVSPRLQVRFDWSDESLQLVGPDGRRFATFQELVEQREAAERAQAEAERARDAALQEREAERERAERLAARLRELGVDPGA